jgi:hypothetical protein
MPLLQAMSERANLLFARENIGAVTWPGGVQFSEIARKLGIAKTDAEEEFLNAWPTSLQRCIIGVFETALASEPRTSVTTCWVPDYDFSVSVWDAHATPGSARAITMVLRSPYPPDGYKGR